MKKLFVFLMTFSITIACQKERDGSEKQIVPEYNVQSDIFSEVEIGYIDSEDEFVKINSSEFELYIAANFDIEDAEFYSHVISEYEEDYSIISKAENLAIGTYIAFDEETGQYRIAGGTVTCSCTSTKCNQAGDCEVDVSAPGCKCSYCYDECTKTSTHTSDPVEFFGGL